jgi:hypothetical protein
MATGAAVAAVDEYLRDLQAAGRSAATARSYGIDLLRWFRFLWAVDVAWDRAGRLGETIDAWYSGKHRDFGANIQAVIRPDGLPIWTSPAMRGHLHDTSCARELGVTAALNWSAAELDLPALADSGYESAGHGIKTPIKQPADGKPLAVDNRAYNRLLRGLRWQGERGFAILIGRWKTLRHATVSPRRIGDIVAAALHLTHYEYKYLSGSC